MTPEKKVWCDGDPEEDPVHVLTHIVRGVGEHTDIPQPEKHEVQLQMQVVGICGSDIHFWMEGRCGRMKIYESMILGHEASGIVSAVGQNVTHLKIGDRVAVEPGVPCCKCSFCKSGRYNLCLGMKEVGIAVNGGLRQYHCHLADFCFKLPDHVTFEEGAFLEPLAVGIHACQRGGVKLGNRVLICGAGTIGLVTLATAKALGAGKIAITDIVESRLKVAKELGADETILADTSDGREMAKKIQAQCGWQPEVTIECSGVSSCLQTAIYVTKSGGCVVNVGLGPLEVEVPIVEAATREIDIRGVCRYLNCFPIALSMVANGLIDVKPLITHHFPLKECVKAFETAKTGKDGAIKVMIHCN